MGTKRASCVPVRAYFEVPVDRNFPEGTLICGKWYEDDYETFIGEKCVGLGYSEVFSPALTG